MNISSVADIAINLRPHTIYILHGFKDRRGRVSTKKFLTVYFNWNWTVQLINLLEISRSLGIEIGEQTMDRPVGEK